MTHKVSVLGLGAGDLDQLQFGVYRKLKEADHLFLRTKEHPVISELKDDISFRSFDDIYEKHDQFEDVYGEIVARLLDEAETADIHYAVPGHPLVAERTVQLLLAEAKEKGVEVVVEGGQSFLDPMFAALQVDPIEGCQVVDATDFNVEELEMKHHLFICQVYDAFVASEVKLSLMEKYLDDYEVVVVTAAGSNQEVIKRLPLYELDREVSINNLTSVYVPPVQDDALLYHEFSKLKEVIATLRGPDGCPWDKKQTHESLKKYLIEEAYEVIDAIDEKDDQHLAEELGDVLLQIMLHSQIGEDEGMFDVRDVIYSITEKMIRRHPHVFGEGTAENAEEVLQNWEQIKKEEQGHVDRKSRLDGIPKALPGLLRAYELQKKAAKVGFDWKEIGPVWDKVMEELDELKHELEQGNAEEAKKEFGDTIFALVNLGRFYKMDPEEALRLTNGKFYDRFTFIEESATEAGLDIEKMTLDEMDELWEKAKLGE